MAICLSNSPTWGRLTTPEGAPGLFSGFPHLQKASPAKCPMTKTHFNDNWAIMTRERPLSKLPNEDLNMSRPPLPPFTAETAAQKVRIAEDAWNTRDPARVALAYTPDSRWRNRSEFLEGRAAIEAFLTRKWSRELDYRLIKEVWAFRENRIAVRFAYEWHDDSGNWFRSYGNENWEFDENGLM